MERDRNEWKLGCVTLGCCPATHEGKTVYISHPNIISGSRTDNVYEEVYNDAIEKGVLTDDETLKSKIKTKEWSKDYDKK